jgi:hypothetical protein
VDRNGVIPMAQELAEEPPAEVGGLAGDAGDGQALRARRALI